MRPLQLDLVRHRPAWPAWAVLLIGLFLAVEAGLDHQRAQRDLLELQRPRSEARLAQAGAEPVSEQTQRELEAARRLLQELVLPWDALFRSIETAIDRDTALLAIEPDADRRSVRIIGEARNYRAILDFVVRLEEKQGLAQIHLLNHQVREDVAERPFMFTLAANWGVAP